MINAMTTLDLLPTLGPLTPDKAARWVAALLAGAAASRAWPGGLTRPGRP